jgi:murein DD-endopeptidase MepM/ murein hydrolase activator NlpD
MLNKMLLLVYLSIFGFSPNMAQSNTNVSNKSQVQVSPQSVGNGHVILVRIKPAASLQLVNAKIDFLGQQTPIFKHPYIDHQYFALVPVPFDQAGGEFELVTHDEQKFNIKVTNTSPKPESLTVDAVHFKPIPSVVVPGSVDEFYQKRAAELKQMLKSAYTINHMELSWTKAFTLPMDSAVTSQFGSKRFYNSGKLKSYHMGTDFRAPVGQPVRSPSAGIVKFDAHLSAGGRTVIIEHGHGVISTFGHLSVVKVVPGDRVEQGQIIALSGNSGRVTAPHLHFETRLHNESVDPLTLIKQISKLFAK